MVFEILLGLWGADKIVRDAQQREWARARDLALALSQAERDASLYLGFNNTLGWEKFVVKKPFFGRPYWCVRPEMRRARSPESEVGEVVLEWLNSQPGDVVHEIRNTTQEQLDQSLSWELLSSKKWSGLFNALNRKAGFPKFYWGRVKLFGHKQWRARPYVPFSPS